ncbi:MAG TPA: DUF1801 domain-containing protein [Thermoanaerobaculia bacterium]|nr:DUF1801 domain-containing protein [Thermoanaerobaculia bacterium]
MAKAATVRTETRAGAEKRLAGFIAKFDADGQARIRSIRRALRRLLPTAHELVWDNYNFFVIGYSATERPSDALLSMAADANGVGLSFYRGADVPDPKKILLGSGVQNRFLRLESAKTLDRPEVRALIAAAIAQLRVPLPESGRGTLVIRSVSKKQRPRRRAKK